MQTPRLLFTLCAIALTFIFPSLTRAAELSANDKQFLQNYEQVRAALAADDLAGAKKAAASLGDEGSDLAKSDTLKDARKAFGKLSEQAVKLASGQPGFHVMHCPMVNKDWVQTSDKVANPYYGKEMLTCGEEKK